MNSDNRWLVLFLSVAFVARMAYGLHAPAKTADGRVVDIDHYASLAASGAAHGELLDSNGLASAEREPGYPLALGLVFKFFGSGYLPFLVAQSLLGTGTLWLLFLIGKNAFGALAGLSAAAVGALYPQFIYYTALPVRETWTTGIDLLSLWALIQAIRVGRLRDFAIAGLCTAVAALSATTFLPFGLFVIPALIVFLGKPRARAFKNTGVYLAIFIAFYSLWPLRNYAALHRWILGSTTASGDHFYMFMIVPEEIGGTPEHQKILDADPTWQKGYALPAADRENFFWKAGLEKIRKAPMAYVRLVAWRFFCDEWRLVPRPRDYGHSYRLIWWVSMLSDGWIIPLGILGLCLSRLRQLETRVGFAFILSISFAYSLVLTMLRYRLVLMPWMILFAAYTLIQGYQRCCRSA